MDFPSAGYMDSNPDNSGYARKPLSENTIRSLTIKQIKNANTPQDGVFKVDNTEITQVTFVGIIRNVAEQATNYIYTVEDGTGAIEARKWVEQNESPDEADARRALLVDTYVRVNGKLNSFNNRITFMAHQIRPITDFNEISYHFLETIRTHLTFTRPGKSSAFTDNTMSAGGMASTGNSIHDRVNAAIKSFDSAVDGCSIDQICFKLKDMYTENEIKNTLEDLQLDGQCYTTIDSNHFKSCLP